MDDQILKTIDSLSLSSGHCRELAREQLDRWFQSSIKLIEDVYREKCEEIDRLFEKTQENLQSYKKRQLTTIDKQNRELLRKEVEEVQRQLPNLIDVKNTPGSIENLRISLKTNVLDDPTVVSSLRHILLRSIPVQIYRINSTCRAMASNGKRDEILLYDKDELVLYHVNGTLGGSVSWSSLNDGFVSDIIWCSGLNSFLVLSRMTLALFDPHLFTLTPVKQIRGTQSNYFISLTYVEENRTILICCHDSKEIIRRYEPFSNWNLSKTWSKENLIEKDDAGVRCLRVSPSGSFVALVIKNKIDQFRVSFYSIDFNEIFTTISIVSSSPVTGSRCLDFMLYLSPFFGDRWWVIVYGNGVHEHSLLLLDRETKRCETIVNESILNSCILDEQYFIVRMKHAMFIYDMEQIFLE